MNAPLVQRLLLALTLAGTPLAVGACDDDRPAAADTHVCPMHPNRTGAAGAKCPDCGMDLVPK